MISRLSGEMMDQFADTLNPDSILGVDFGTGSLVCGSARGEEGGFTSLAFPGWSEEIPLRQGSEPVHRIPVLVHYPETGEPVIGEEVVQAGKEEHPATARWIRNYLLEESTARISAGPERWITFRDAAADFLGAVLMRAVRDRPGIGSVVFAAPIGAPHWYTGWLSRIAQDAGIPSCHVIGEHAATAAGYGITVAGGESFVLISVDETDLTVLVVRNNSSPGTEGLVIAGIARDDTGCRELDAWIAQEVVTESRVRYTGTRARELYEAVFTAIGCEHTQLAEGEGTTIDFTDPVSARVFSIWMSHEDIRRILGKHDFPTILERTVKRVWAAACTRGCTSDTPLTVLMIGRGSAIPAVQEIVQHQFPGVPVRWDRPFDAIARGAALLAPATPRADRIQNDYALRYWDPEAREHRYRFLVRSGARYPSAGQVARITISAAYDGQTRLGIPLYEIVAAPEAAAPAIELVSDPAGGVRLAGPMESADRECRPVLANGRTPMLLAADPPAVKSEPRFELTFILDRERHLRVTARDLITGMLVKRDAPVHRLT